MNYPAKYGPGLNWVLSLLALFLFVFHLTAWILSAPCLFADPAWGLLTVQNHLGGGDWNTLKQADASDLTRDVESWVSWWAPAQHMTPEFFIKIFGFSIGRAVKATSLICYLCAFFGWFELMRRLTGGARTGLACLLVIMSSRYATLYFFNFDGGETLLFAYFPWFLLIWHYARRDLNAFWRIVAGIAAIFAGLIIKYTFIVPLAGVFIYEACCAHKKKLIVCDAAAGIFCLTIFYWLFISPGSTPLPLPGIHASFSFKHAVFSFVAPFLAMTDLGSLLNRIFLFPGKEILTGNGMFILYLALLPVVALLMFWIFKKMERFQKTDLFHLIAIVYLTFFIAMFCLYLGGADVSYEARHFRIAGVLFIPAFILSIKYSIAHARDQALGLSLALFFLILPAVYGMGGVADKAFLRKDGFVSSATQIKHHILDEKTFGALKNFFEPANHDRNRVAYFTSPEIALEFAGERKLVVHADFVDIHELEKKKYKGNCDVILVLPSRFESNGKMAAIKKSFVDIVLWKPVPNPGGGFDIFLGKTH